jgi:hypothetical protein
MARTGLIMGALAGWRRQMTPTGCVFKLEITEHADPGEEDDFRHVDIILDDKQIGSLARDLLRAADRRGIDLWPKPTLVGQLLGHARGAR